MENNMAYFQKLCKNLTLYAYKNIGFMNWLNMYLEKTFLHTAQTTLIHY